MTARPEMIRALSASMLRLKAMCGLLTTTATLLSDGRCDDDAAGRILIAAGAAVNAMRAEREAISQTQKPTT